MVRARSSEPKKGQPRSRARRRDTDVLPLPGGPPMMTSKLEERDVCHVTQPTCRVDGWPGKATRDVTPQTLIGLEIVDKPPLQGAARRAPQSVGEQDAEPEHRKERQVAPQALAKTRVGAATWQITIEEQLPTLGIEQ